MFAVTVEEFGAEGAADILIDQSITRWSYAKPLMSGHGLRMLGYH